MKPSIASRSGTRRLRLLVNALEAAREAVIITDHTDDNEPIIYVNEAFTKLTGYTLDEVIGNKCSFLQREDCRQPELKPLSDAIKAGKPHETTLRNYRRDGQLFMNRLSLTPIEEDGRVTHYFGFLSDVTEHLANMRTLQISERRWRALFEKMQEGFYIGKAVRDDSGRMIDFLPVEMNPAVESLLGLTPDYALGIPFRTLFPEASDNLIRQYASVLDTGRPAHFEFRMPELEQRWYEVRAYQVDAEHFSVLFMDVTTRKIAELALAESEAKFRTFAQALPNLVWAKPAHGPVDWYNEKVYEYAGTTAENLYVEQWWSIVHPDDIDAARAVWNRSIENGNVFQFELRLRSADGSYRWFLTRASALRDEANHVTRWIGTNTDIHEQKLEAARLDYLSSYDPLTGLLNRNSITEYLTGALQLPDAIRSPIAVLFVDLDHFKQINNVHGRAFGDQILRDAGLRFLGILSPGDRLARLSGDEFLFVALNGGQKLSELIQAILVCAKTAFVVDGAEFSLNASIGIARYPDDGITSEALMSNADIAMYQAKLAGRGVARMFDPKMASRQQQILQISNELRQAIVRSEMRLHYQPIVSLKTGAMSSAEGLLRWQHPKRGLLGAGEFITIAEESQSIVALGRWALEEACRQLREWDDRGLHLARISINIAARHLVDESLPDYLRELLHLHEMEPKRLGIEVTESMVMSDMSIAAAVLHELHDIGFCISLDDFGTGFSNVTSLHNFWFDSLKIDRSFIQSIGTDRERNSAKLTQAVIAMSSALGLHTVAEGVETQAQLEFLADNGCDSVQGFLISPAIPAADFEDEFLARAFRFDRLPR